MKNSLFISFVILVILTLTGVSASYLFHAKWAVFIILLFAVIKFYIVGFEFMEIKTAHSFWKTIFIIYALIIGSVIWFLI